MFYLFTGDEMQRCAAEFYKLVNRYNEIGDERIQKGAYAWTYAKAFGFVLSVVCTIG